MGGGIKGVFTCFGVDITQKTRKKRRNIWLSVELRKYTVFNADGCLEETEEP